MAALLYGRAGSMLTGLAALRRHGLTSNPPRVLDVLAPVTVQRRDYGLRPIAADPAVTRTCLQ